MSSYGNLQKIRNGKRTFAKVVSSTITEYDLVV